MTPPSGLLRMSHLLPSWSYTTRYVIHHVLAGARQELDSLSGTIEQGVHELVELVHQHDPTRADESSSGFVEETDGDSDATGCESAVLYLCFLWSVSRQSCCRKAT